MFVTAVCVLFLKKVGRQKKQRLFQRVACCVNGMQDNGSPVLGASGGVVKLHWQCRKCLKAHSIYMAQPVAIVEKITVSLYLRTRLAKYTKV